MSKISPVTQRFSQIKTDMVWAVIDGNYKAYKNAKITFAKEAINNFEAAKNAKGPNIERVPIFSKLGLKMAKIWLLDKLRRKTPEEKILKQLVKQDKRYF